MSSNLQALINAIQTAEDGHVITREYHNTLRAALVEVARLLGASAADQTFKLTLAPAFFKNGTGSEWTQLNGVATAVIGKSNNGLLPVQLPDGARLQSLTVTGRRKGNIDGLEVKLIRQAITGTSLTTLISIPLEDQGDPFTVSRDIIQLPDLGSAAATAAAEDFRTIDNKKYKYMIVAQADGATDVPAIHMLQLTYTR